MANYYEYLEVQLDATTAEIQQALDAKYNQWRRLVTHHDPERAQQANQALIYIERIRGTLLDPSRRASYDASLFGTVGGTVGGLADPQSQPQPGFRTPAVTPFGAPVPPPSQIPPQPSQVVIERIDAWICGKCNQANQIGHTYCKKCGATIGRVCANCNTVYETKASFCPSCGMTPESVEKRNQIQTQLRGLHNEHTLLLQQAGNSLTPDRVLDTLAISTLGWTVFLFAYSALFMIFASFRVGVSFLSQHTPDFYQNLNGLFNFLTTMGGVGRFLIWAGALAAFVFVMLSRKKMNVIALIGYFLTSFGAFGFSSFNLTSYVRPNTSMVFPIVVTGFLALICGVLLSSVDARIWLLVGLTGVLCFVALLMTPASPVISLIGSVIGIALAILLALLGLRAWSVAELQGQRVDREANDRIARISQIEKEIQGLNIELQRITDHRGV
jgi:curved DNA-binding protein CbpA